MHFFACLGPVQYKSTSEALKYRNSVPEALSEVRFQNSRQVPDKPEKSQRLKQDRPDKVRQIKRKAVKDNWLHKLLSSTRSCFIQPLTGLFQPASPANKPENRKQAVNRVFLQRCAFTYRSQEERNTIKPSMRCNITPQLSNWFH